MDTEWVERKQLSAIGRLVDLVDARSAWVTAVNRRFLAANGDHPFEICRRVSRVISLCCVFMIVYFSAFWWFIGVFFAFWEALVAAVVRHNDLG